MATYFGSSFVNALTQQIRIAQEREAMAAIEKRRRDAEESRLLEQRRYTEAIAGRQAEAEAERQAKLDKRYETEQTARAEQQKLENERAAKRLQMDEKNAASLEAQRKASAAASYARATSYLSNDEVTKLPPADRQRYQSMERSRALIVSRLNAMYKSPAPDYDMIERLNADLDRVEGEIELINQRAGSAPIPRVQRPPATSPAILPQIYSDPQSLPQKPVQDNRIDLGIDYSKKKK